MAIKNICRIPREWNLADYRQHNCQDGSHTHLSRSQIYIYESRGLVVWLKHPSSKRDNGIVWIVGEIVEIDKIHQEVLAASPLTTGLSFRVGAELAGALSRRAPWAETMLSQIEMRREVKP